MYKIVLRKTVIKFLDKHQAVKIRLWELLPIIKNDPISYKLDIKKLTGSENNYRLRIGKWRFLYTVDHDQVYIYFYDAGSRWDIYK